MRYFIAVYGEGSISKAAGREHVVQPALSIQIRQLEADFAVRLFQRSPHGMDPTPAGDFFYKLCIGLSRDLSSRSTPPLAILPPTSSFRRMWRPRSSRNICRKCRPIVTLATREHAIIPEYGSGVVSPRNLDAMMRNTSLMVDAAREDGRAGYNRAARGLLSPTLSYRIASLLAERCNLRNLLARPLADRFELMICRRAVLERLLVYNDKSLRRFVGDRMAEVLEGILRGRLEAVDQVLEGLRTRFPGHTRLLERRLLLLFALSKGAGIIDTMKAESVLSAEVATRLGASLRMAWEANIRRPVPPERDKAIS
ncbi:LysR family transcriptional regulator (plasmid) [Agrobacterium radiobacter]|uniref:HTH lysR-type domain-containing protein n=1 Tax=Agrobacterium tumefaciens str. B6 TaxID=1183423 RepID=A0A822VEJ2_AGRTU|nr:LysR family transcriptional regulator [Agrobacterium tumefaciens]NTA08362.1 LysR family transcriptional regulator [Agrobacterium tumefaciens]NTB16184.1 LysR family transcriptional regulator [Agrobacterium tumefaciens]CVI25214.1 hypothetical protein AGR4A_pAt30029 [Agrobacterium tumefaciens str. B6]SPZ33133.1 LysR family transcriptional regulator [Agrobacterium tumefaciens]